MARATRLLRRSGPTIRIAIWAAGWSLRAWSRLSDDERTELWALVRKSRVRPGTLTKREWQRVVELLRAAGGPGDRR